MSQRERVRAWDSKETVVERINIPWPEAVCNSGVRLGLLGRRGGEEANLEFGKDAAQVKGVFHCGFLVWKQKSKIFEGRNKSDIMIIAVLFYLNKPL